MHDAQTAGYQTMDARADIMKMARRAEAKNKRLRPNDPLNRPQQPSSTQFATNGQRTI